MKKLIFAAFAAGAMVLAGCTKVEVKDVSETRAIGFDNFVSNAVKSIGQNSDLTNFYVYGGVNEDSDLKTLFENQEMTVSWSSDDATVDYSPLRYWTANKTYQFAAYSNDNDVLNSGVNINYDASKKAYLTINYTTDGTKDLVYAQSANNSYTYTAGDGDIVNFDFYHILSNVSFKFSKDATLDDIDVEIKELQISSISTNGTFIGSGEAINTQYEYNTWENQGTPDAQIIKFTTPKIEINSGNTTSTPVYLIPQAAGNSNASLLKITFTLTPTADVPTGLVEKKFEVNLPATADNRWNPGYSYIYAATISAETFEAKPIVFDVTSVNTWSETTPDVDITDDITITE